MKKTIPRRSLTTIFSGIQPTGIPHLGNYLGAVSNWVRLQQTNTDRVLYSVVDLHALTLPQEPSVLRADILNATATLLACGVSPERSCVFQQSTVKEHAELAWLLSCITPKGWLNRMTQYKDKKEKGAGEQASLGLYSYPVLMAADILLYNTTHVPVGHDQKQHLELARDIAIKFNSNQIKGGVFNIPVGIFSEGTSTRVMSLNDGTKKMSKSDPSSLSRINLDDAPDEIMKKIKKAKTDGERGFLSATTSEGEIMRPEVNNLLGIRAALEDKSVQEVALELDGRDAQENQNPETGNLSKMKVTSNHSKTFVSFGHFSPKFRKIRDREKPKKFAETKKMRKNERSCPKPKWLQFCRLLWRK